MFVKSNRSNSFLLASALFALGMPLVLGACSEHADAPGGLSTREQSTMQGDNASRRSTSTTVDESDYASAANKDRSNQSAKGQQEHGSEWATEKGSGPAGQSASEAMEESASSTAQQGKKVQGSETTNDGEARENLTKARHLGSKAKTEENAPGPQDEGSSSAR